MSRIPAVRTRACPRPHRESGSNRHPRCQGRSRLDRRRRGRGGIEASRIDHILVRPEDLRVYDRSEARDDDILFPGIVEEVIYKGSTVDLMVRLTNNQLVADTEFFDEDDENLEYEMGEPVYIQWKRGWEVLLPNDEI